MLGPTLEAEHVRLEPPRPEHLGSFVRWFADPEVTRYLLRRHPPTLRQEEAWLERTAASKSDVVWAVFLPEGATIIGVCGLHRIDWRSRHGWIEISLGDRSQWGKGYATEATRTVTGYAFTELGLEKVLVSVYVGNQASVRILGKVGYRQCGLLRRHAFFGGEWHDELLGELCREEWKAPCDLLASPSPQRTATDRRPTRAPPRTGPRSRSGA
jgi:[ribosomal protein S5]-alanine N-acetyltransferase